jgi:signal transduction histidine kinase
MQQHKKMETLLIIAMTLDLLALILGIFLSAHLTAKPLKTFVRVIDHARSANTFNIRLPETGPREIVSLASMFNTLFTEREQARKESLHQAIEAGRAQLSAMVLHNIGNAVTPLTVLPKRLTGKEMEDIRIFLEKCVEDLKEHRETLSDYVNTDSRGRRVFEYMEDLIRSLKDENARQKSLVQKIETSIAYISEVLSLQQSYAPRAGEIKEKVDLNDILNTAIRIQGPGLEKSRIRVERNLSPDLAPILIDKSRLLQVLINLIKNSCEAIDQAGDMTAAREIRVTTFTRETGMGFTLEDTGVGIDPSAGKKIFEFGESRKGSSGMGLYYCRMFVESNHGTISLASSGLNQGAAVRVEFSKPTDQSK